MKVSYVIFKSIPLGKQALPILSDAGVVVLEEVASADPAHDPVRPQLRVEPVSGGQTPILSCLQCICHQELLVYCYMEFYSMSGTTQSS